MKTIEERAKEYAPSPFDPDEIIYTKKGYVVNVIRDAYIVGANAQKDIDIEKAKTTFSKACGWLSTYPWYNGVFEEFIKSIEE